MIGDEHMDDEAFGEELRAAVHRLERGEGAAAEVRERAAARMHDAYAMRVANKPMPASHAHAEITTLVTDEPTHRTRLRRLTLATAAVLLVGLLALGWFVRSDDSPAPADVPPETSIPESLPVPGQLGAGTITTDVLGPQLTMTSEEPLWLLRAAPGVVELGLGPSESDPSTLTIVRPGRLSQTFGVDSIESLFESLPSSQEQPNIVGGRSALSWRLLDPGGTELCPGELCLPLFDEPPSVTIPADRVVDVFEFSIVGDETAVLIVSSAPGQFGFDYGGPFVDVIKSIEIEDTPSAADPPTVPRVDVALPEPTS